MYDIYLYRYVFKYNVINRMLYWQNICIFYLKKYIYQPNYIKLFASTNIYV